MSRKVHVRCEVGEKLEITSKVYLSLKIEELENYCQEQEIEDAKVIKDIGSGINYRKSGLKKLIKEIILGKVRRIVVTYQDRLLRFGCEMVQQICKGCIIEFDKSRICL